MKPSHSAVVRATALALLVCALLVTRPIAVLKSAGALPQIVTMDGVPVVAGEVLVKYRRALQSRERQQIDVQVDADRNDAIGGAGVRRVHSKRHDTRALLALLRNHPDVEYAEPNYVVTADVIPDDPWFDQLWGLLNNGQVVGKAGTPGADIKATQAWEISTGSAANVVAVIDTGIEYTHSDLAANVWTAPAAFNVTIAGRTITCPAGSHGFNAIALTCDPADDNGHGTHVSGTIGAVGNNINGVVGVNWTTSIMASKFLGPTGTGTASDAINAIEFVLQAAAATGANVRVLSNSWSVGGFSQALLDEINKANVKNMLFVASAGNSSANNDIVPSYPASYSAPNVISVAATDNTDTIATFSNFGLSVHLAAPGTNILSTYLGDSVQYLSGTSMAAPHVSGAAALVLSKCALDTAALKANLLANVDPIPLLAGKVSTGGRLNVDAAIRACGLPPDFAIAATPALQTSTNGTSTTYTINVTGSGGFTNTVTLAATGLPLGATATFVPASIVAPGSSTLTVTPGVTTPFGNFPLTITGTSGTLSHTASVTFVTNHPPVAVADSATTAEDTAVTIAVLANDTDADGDVLKLTSASAALHGTAGPNADGTITYTPSLNYNGSDSFTYTISDGRGGTATGTVTVTITPVNDPPVATGQSVTTAEDTPKAITLTATDVDGDPLTYAIVLGPAHGTISGVGVNITYTPALNYNGSDSFTFKANDGKVDSNVATVAITVTAVNDPPVAANDTYSTNEDTALTIAAPGVLANDTDVDSATITAVLVAAPAHGTLTLNTNGSFTYTPAANYNGPDSFTYKANDGSLDSNVATASITVIAVNDAPVAASQTVAATEDLAKAIALSATDVDGDTLTYTVVAAPTHGTLTGVAPNLTYTPAANYNGPDSLTFKANDGLLDSNVATVTITVAAVNDAPSFTNGPNQTVLEEAAAQTVTGWVTNISAGPADEISQTLNFIVTTTNAALFSAAPAISPTGTLTYTVAPTANGSATVTVQLHDNGGVLNGGVDTSAAQTFTITVTAVNDAPSFTKGADQTALQGATAQTVTGWATAISAGPPDESGQLLNFIITAANPALFATQPAVSASGTLTYTPSATTSGSTTVTVQLHDNGGVANGGVDTSAAQTFTITITQVNHAPVANAQSVTTAEDTAKPITLTATDADGDTLTYAIVTAPAHGTLSGVAPAVTYTPAANYNGPDSFTFKANDGTVDSTPAAVTITVTPVNDAPVANAQAVTTAEDTAKAITLTATDVDGDPLTYAIVTAPAHGTLSGTAPAVTYTPALNYNGPDSFTFKANDGLLDSLAATVTMTVTPVNDPPVAANDSYSSPQDTTLTIAAPGVLSNDVDVDGDTLTAAVVVGPTHGTLTLSANGGFTYSPAAAYSGPDSFTYKASDATLASNIATVSLTITHVNHAPVANAQSVTTAEDTAKAITLTATDADGDTLTYSIVTAPAHGTLSGVAPAVTYAPAANYNGPDSFTFKANDGTIDSTPATVTITVTPVNDAPVANAQAVTTAEDTAKAITLTATDVDGDPLTYAIVTAPAHGTLSGTAPAVTYTPALNYNGPDSFTFKANDGLLDSLAATVTITVTPVNDPPVAANDSYTSPQDTTLTIAAPGVLANDVDVDGDTLTAAVVAGPTHGTLTLSANGGFTYTPAAAYSGPDSFTYKANDATTSSNIATVSLTITHVNHAPIANAQSVTTAEDTAKAITLTATDADGDTLTYSIVTAPAHGTLSGIAPAVTYTPAANYNGPDSFTFKANDGTLDSTPATVTITVTPVNDAPVANAQSVTTAEDTAKAITLTATDVDGDPLTYAIVIAPAHGTLSGTAPAVTYTPALNYNGPDSFTFKANDGLLDSLAATVTITVTPVNDPPVAANDSYTAPQDTTLTIAASGVLSNDVDVDGDTLTAAVVVGPTHGTLTLSANGGFTYSPAAAYSGPDSFTYKASDATLASNIATVSLTITHVNHAPVANAQSVTTAEDTAKAITLTATDADGDTLTYSVVTAPVHGTLSGIAPAVTYTPAANYNGPDSFTFKANDGTLDSTPATVTITVTPVNDAPVANAQSVTTAEDTAKAITLTATDVDGDPLTYAIVAAPAHGTLSGTAPAVTYTPALNYNGPDSFTFKANDGLLDSLAATVTITVTPVNDSPVAANDTYTSPQDTTLTIAAPGVLSNDIDVDGDTLTAAVVVGPTHGTLTLSANGGFTYTPAAAYSGPDSFTYKASDATLSSNIATVSLTITHVNHAPVANAPSVTTAEDTAKAITLTATDADGDALTYSIVATPAHGTLSGIAPAVTYTPAANYNGPDSFTFKANDGLLDSLAAAVTITVTPVNDAPVANAQSVTTAEDAPAAVTLTASDVDGDPLTYIIVAAPAHGTLSGTAPALTYTPALHYFGPDSFTFKANDGTVDSLAATVSLTVTHVNQAPVATAQSVTTAEDTAKTIALTATDIDGDPLTFSIVTAPAHGTLSGTAPAVTYTPAANYNGPDSFTFKANDGVLDSAPAAVTITVTAVNDPPVAANDAYTSPQDTTLTIAAPGVLANDTDVDGDPLTAAVVAAPAHGTLTLNANGSFTYVPAANYSGPDSFTYKANDATLASNIATVSLTITHVNHAPVATGDAYTTLQDQTLTIAAPGVLANDTDIDGDALTAIAVTAPAHGTLTLNANGSFTYVPAASYSGPDSFTYKASDGTLASNIATVSLTVTHVNHAPVATAQAVTTAEDTAKAITLAATDADGDALTYGIVTAPLHGTLSGTAPAVTYTPAANYNGPDSFTFKANDGTVDSSAVAVTITVTAVNDPPVANAQTVTTAEDTAAAITLAATDVDGDALTYSIVTAPAHGTLSGAAPSVTYTPAANYNGSDSFTFKASDGSADSNVATVSIVVNAVNDAPVAADETVATDEDTPKAIVLAATDVDSTTLTYAVVTGPAHGTLSGTAPNVTYTPAANYNGADSFTYKANDGALDSNVATVTITVAPVNDAPVAASQSVSTNENVAKAIALAATDVDSTTLTYAIVLGPAHGTLSGVAPNVTYTPAANYFGPDSFTFKANDGSLDSNIATVTITVVAVNQAPVAANDSYATDEDTTILIAAPGVLSNDTDVDSTTLTAIVVTAPAHGSLTLAANGGFNYLPAANYNGPDSFTYKANDGSLDSNVATVSITVRAVNDAPVAANDSYATDENTPLTIAAPGVLANDTDIDSPVLTAVVVAAPAHGTLTLNANGSFTYTPAANYNGADSFTYTANDGSLNSNAATVAITVRPVNDPPVASGQSVVTNEDTPKAIVLAATDIDSTTLTYTIVLGPTHGTLSGVAPNVTYTPAPNYNGSDSFTFKANDGALDSNVATVSIGVNAVNDAPVAADQSVAADEDTAKAIILAATDVDSPTLTYSFVAAPAHGTLSGVAPNVTYTPAANYNGADSFTFKANDGVLDSNIATVAITVRAINDAPSFTKGADQTVAQGSGAKVVTGWATAISAGPSDESSQLLNFIVTNDNSAIFSAQPAVDATGTLTFTPAAGANGVAHVTVQIHDNGGTLNGGIDTSAPQTFTITIQAAQAQGIPTLSINDASIIEGNTGTRPMVFTVTLSAASSSTVTVAYATLAGTASSGKDYQATSGTLTFAPGDTTKTVSVLVIGDGFKEANETLVVRLSSPTNATLVKSDGLGTIIDDDSGTMLLVPTTSSTRQ